MHFSESFFSSFIERSWVLGDSCAFNSVGDCAFNAGWRLVCVRFGGFFGAEIELKKYSISCLFSFFVSHALFVKILKLTQPINELSSFGLHHQPYGLKCELDELLDMLEMGGWSQGYFCIPELVTGDVVVIGFSSIINGDEGTNKW
ncbi:hypothetical protein ACSQ67_020862 [Phaseolus vulgaris]